MILSAIFGRWMPAELIAQGTKLPFGEAPARFRVDPQAKAREQRKCCYWQYHLLVDHIAHHPRPSPESAPIPESVEAKEQRQRRP
jgi:hypothetical protein